MPALPELSIAHYRHFLLVAELRSFRAAAARAFRSQPALSLSIREMEQRLGQPLFERGNGNALTRFGQDCLPLARELVEHHDRVAGTLAGLASNEAGTLTMASVATVATHWLPELVAAYRERFPAVALRLFDDNSEGWNAWSWLARSSWAYAARCCATGGWDSSRCCATPSAWCAIVAIRWRAASP